MPDRDNPQHNKAVGDTMRGIIDIFSKDKCKRAMRKLGIKLTKCFAPKHLVYLVLIIFYLTAVSPIPFTFLTDGDVDTGVTAGDAANPGQAGADQPAASNPDAVQTGGAGPADNAADALSGSGGSVGSTGSAADSAGGPTGSQDASSQTQGGSNGGAASEPAPQDQTAPSSDSPDSPDSAGSAGGPVSPSGPSDASAPQTPDGSASPPDQPGQQPPDQPAASSSDQPAISPADGSGTPSSDQPAAPPSDQTAPSSGGDTAAQPSDQPGPPPDQPASPPSAQGGSASQTPQPGPAPGSPDGPVSTQTSLDTAPDAATQSSLDAAVGISPATLDLYGYSSDLADFVDRIVVTDGTGVVWDSDVSNGGSITVAPDTTYSLSMTFTESPFFGGHGEFKYVDDPGDPNCGWLVYTFPPGLNFDDFSGFITGSGGKDIGQYEISGNVLRARFYDVLANGEPTPNGANFIDAYSNAQFTVEATAAAARGSGDYSVDIDFGNNLTVTVNVEAPPVVCQWDILKSAELTSDPGGNGYISYTIMAKIPPQYYNQELSLSDRLTALDASGNSVGVSYPGGLAALKAGMTASVYDLADAAGYNAADLSAVDPSALARVPFDADAWYLKYSDAAGAWDFMLGKPGDAQSLWPVDGYSLLAIKFNVPLSSELDNGSGETLARILLTPPPGDSAGGRAYADNAVTMSSGGDNISADNKVPVTISKTNGNYMGAAPYFTGPGTGEYIFPYNVDIYYPYDTNLREAPVFTDTFDPSLRLAGPPRGFTAALHCGRRDAGLVYDLLITVPDNQIAQTNDGVNGRLSLNLADLANDNAKVFVRAGASGIDYGATPAYSGDTASCWNYIRGQLGSAAGGEWYAQNYSLEGSGGTDGVSAYYSFAYNLTFIGEPPAGVLDGAIELKNTADMQIAPSGGGHLDLKSSCDVPFSIKPVEKTMTADGGAADVSIMINPAAITIAGGPGTVFEARDTMTNLNIYLDSLKVYSIKDGIKTLQTLTSGVMGDNLFYHYYISGAGDEIYLYLPDCTALEIVYSARIMGKPGDEVDIENAVRIAGKYSSSVGWLQVVKDSSGSGTGSRMPVIIFKRSSEDQSLLKGAQFALYGPQRLLVPPVPPGGVPPTIYVGGAPTPTQYYFYEAETTDAQGRAVFDSDMIWPDEGWVYALVETAAPDGYEPLGSPVLFAVNGNLARPLPGGITEDMVTVIPTDNMTLTDVPSGPKLPETGGGGVLPYTSAGTAMISFAAAVLLRRKFPKKGGVRL